MIETSRSRYPADLLRAADSPAEGGLEDLVQNALGHLKDFAHDHPVEFGLWAFGVGFILGWKLKPW